MMSSSLQRSSTVPWGDLIAERDPSYRPRAKKPAIGSRHTIRPKEHNPFDWPESVEVVRTSETTQTATLLGECGRRVRVSWDQLGIFYGEADDV